jgi:hypothetical protein
MSTDTAIDFDPDVDLDSQISNYSLNELKQLKKITLEVLKHWEDMLKVAGGRMNEGTKMAVDLSMEQAKKDLALIHEKMKQLGANPESPKLITDGQVSDSAASSTGDSS